METRSKTRALASNRHNSGRFPRVSNRESFVANETGPYVNASTSCLRSTHVDGLESCEPFPLVQCGHSTLQYVVDGTRLLLWLWMLPFIQYNLLTVIFIPPVFKKGRQIDVSSRRANDKRRISWNITSPGRYEWIEHRTTFLPNKYFGDFL
jgi:hypothetical protein